MWQLAVNGDAFFCLPDIIWGSGDYKTKEMDVMTGFLWRHQNDRNIICQVQMITDQGRVK